jgi:hypothetical protein
MISSARQVELKRPSLAWLFAGGAICVNAFSGNGNWQYILLGILTLWASFPVAWPKRNVPVANAVVPLIAGSVSGISIGRIIEREILATDLTGSSLQLIVNKGTFGLLVVAMVSVLVLARPKKLSTRKIMRRQEPIFHIQQFSSISTSPEQVRSLAAVLIQASAEIEDRTRALDSISDLAMDLPKMHSTFQNDYIVELQRSRQARHSLTEALNRRSQLLGELAVGLEQYDEGIR